jgi:hypothetical protein
MASSSLSERQLQPSPFCAPATVVIGENARLTNHL